MLFDHGRFSALCLICCLILLHLGCGGHITGPHVNGGLKIFLTDSPLNNVQHVYVILSTIKVHQAGKGDGNEGLISLPPPNSPIDLLVLQGKEELLSSDALEDGIYTYISLEVSSGTVVSDTAEEYELEIPSGEVLIPVPFTIEHGKLTNVLLDFDAQQSVQVESTRGANIKYILRPVITPVKVEGPKS